MKCEGCGQEHTGWIPESRLSEVTSARDAARAEMTAAQGQAATLETAAATHQKTLDAMAAQLEVHTASAATWETERAVYQHGITEAEGVDFAQLAYGRIPADQRPAGGISEWLQNASALPRGVQAYLPQPATPAAPAAAQTPHTAQPAAAVPRRAAPELAAHAAVPTGGTAAPNDYSRPGQIAATIGQGTIREQRAAMYAAQGLPMRVHPWEKATDGSGQ